MRIVLFTTSKTRSGGTRQAFYLAHGLQELGHRVSFLFPPGSDLLPLAQGLDHAELPESRREWKAFAARVLDQDRKPEEPAVFHAFHNKAVKLASWWGLFWRKPRNTAVFGHRGVIFKPNNPLPYWSPGVDCFIVNSSACATVLRKKGVAERRLRVVYNGVPENRVTPGRSVEAVRNELGLAPDERVLGALLDDGRNKGAEVLLRAFARAQEAGGMDKIKPVLVGVTPDYWAPLLGELGLADLVRLVPRQENVADYLQAFSFMVAPSFSESMPNALMEALFLGVPLVATSVGGVPELVRDNGLLVPPGDVEALALAMARMAGDKGLRASCREKALALAPEFTLKAKVANTLAVYREILARRGLDVR